MCDGIGMKKMRIRILLCTSMLACSVTTHATISRFSAKVAVHNRMDKIARLSLHEADDHIIQEKLTGIFSPDTSLQHKKDEYESMIRYLEQSKKRLENIHLYKDGCIIGMFIVFAIGVGLQATPFSSNNEVIGIFMILGLLGLVGAKRRWYYTPERCKIAMQRLNGIGRLIEQYKPSSV